MSSSSSTSVLSFKIVASTWQEKTTRSGGWRAHNCGVWILFSPKSLDMYRCDVDLCSSLEQLGRVRVLAGDVWLLTTGCCYHSPCAIHGNLFHLSAREKMYPSSKRTEYNLFFLVVIWLLYLFQLWRTHAARVKLSNTQNGNSNWLMYLCTLSILTQQPQNATVGFIELCNTMQWVYAGKSGPQTAQTQTHTHTFI